MTVLARPNGLSHPRLGLAISRKVARRAVARNRIKRIIRESLRREGDRLAGLDVVVLGRPGIDRKNNAELRRSLNMHWKRLASRCEQS